MSPRGRILGPGKLRKRDGLLVLDYSNEHGERRRKALSRDRKTAERIRVETIRRRDMALAGLGGEEGQSMLLTELADLYLPDLESRSKPRHFKSTRTKLLRAIAGVEVPRVRDLRPMHAIRHRSSLQQAGLSTRTANLDIEAMKAMLNWAAENSIIAHNPIRSVKRIPEGKGTEKRPRRALTDAEIECFLAAAVEDDEQCEIVAQDVRIPQAPFWRALLETGARYGELAKATWADVDLERRVLVLRAENTKADKTRSIPIGEQLAGALFSLKVLREQRFGRLCTVTEPVFLSPEGRLQMWHTSNVRRVFDRILKRAGIQQTNVEGKLDIHALRHTFASRLARAGVELVHAQRLLGHSDPKLTAEVYTHVNVEDLRGAVDRMTAPAPGARKPAKEAR